MELSERLNKMALKDKQNNPKYLINVIKSDFFYLISNYFEVNFEDISVEISADEKFYSIKIDCVGERLKTIHALPD